MTTELFHWTSPGGVEIALPRMDKIKAGIIRRHRGEEPVNFIFSVLEAVGDAETLVLVDDLDIEDFNDLVEKWQEGISVGESSGSST